MKKTFLLLIPFFALGAGLAQRQNTAVPIVGISVGFRPVFVFSPKWLHRRAPCGENGHS